MSSTAHETPHAWANQSPARMSPADCFRTLGVEPDASWAAIRQAYKDLVRVWHPDRFQSDPELQRRAEQQLQRVNQAYFTLKHLHAAEGRGPEPHPPPKPAEPPPAPAVNVHPRPPGGAKQYQFRLPVKGAWLALVCLAPLVIGGLLVNALRVPTLDLLTLQNGSARPVILLPSTALNLFGGRSATAAELSSWARSEAQDLWKAIPQVATSVSERPKAASSVVPRDPRRHPDTAVAAPETPPNGTELLTTRMSGGSELWISNPTSQDAVAKLVETGTASPLRAIYIQARSKGCIRHIAPGVYDLLFETGETWDPVLARFEAGRRVLPRSGPYQCFDVSSAQGTYGPTHHATLGAR